MGQIGEKTGNVRNHRRLIPDSAFGMPSASSDEKVVKSMAGGDMIKVGSAHVPIPVYNQTARLLGGNAAERLSSDSICTVNCKVDRGPRTQHSI